METTTESIFYLLLRLTIGASMFGHGMARMPKMKAFSDWMVSAFAKTSVPVSLVKFFSYVIPLGELIIGVLLIIGLFTMPAAIGGGLLMILLILGTSVIENWEIMNSQLIHAAFFAALLHFIDYNGWAIDNLFW